MGIVMYIWYMYNNIMHTTDMVNLQNRSSKGISSEFLFIRICGNVLVYLAAQKKSLDIVVLIMSAYSFIMDLMIYFMILFGRHCEIMDYEDTENLDYYVYVVPMHERYTCFGILYFRAYKNVLGVFE